MDWRKSTRIAVSHAHGYQPCARDTVYDKPPSFYLFRINMNAGSNFYRTFHAIDHETIDYICNANA